MLETLKEIFGDKSITFADFEKAVTEKGYKLADLSKGEYVGKGKYEDALKESESKIKALEDTNKAYEKAAADLKKGTLSLEEHEQKTEKIKSEYKEELAKKEAEFANFKKQSMIKDRLVKEGALDVDNLTDLILAKDKEGKIKLDGDNIYGLDDYVNSFKDVQLKTGATYFKVETNTMGNTPNATNIQTGNTGFTGGKITMDDIQKDPIRAQQIIAEKQQNKL